MGSWAGIVVICFAVIVGGLIVVARRSTARNAVWRLINNGGLPKSEQLMAATEDRFVKQEVVSGGGLAIGGVVAGCVLLLVEPGWSRSLFALGLMAMLAGAGVGSYLQHFRAVRAARPAGPRAATLQPRGLGDYLTRREIVGQHVMIVLPVVAIVLGVLVLTTADGSAARGWVLVIPGVAAIPLAALGLYLQRRILRLNEPASSADELRWQEALRASALREMTKLLVGTSWVCGAWSVGLFDWPAGVPGFLHWFGLAVLGGGTALQVLIWQAAETKGGLRRSQAAIHP